MSNQNQKTMRTILLAGLLSLFALNTKAQTIAAARAQPTLSTVTVRGVVLNGPEMGTIRYLQDNTGGIAAYNSGLSSVNRGDSVIINGPLTDYKALLEIATTTLGNPTPVTYTALGTGITQTPSVITVPNFGENVESRLIKFIGCTFGTTGTFSNNTNYTVTTSSGQFVARVTSTVSNLMGSPIPTGTVNIVGIGSQYCATGGTCNTGYQLALRDMADITIASGINETNKEVLNLSVFPNPASAKINFKVEAGEIIKAVSITDISGKVVYTSKENIASAELHNLNNGIYFIMVNTQSNNYRSKFVISK